MTSKHLHEVALPILVAEVYIFKDDKVLLFKRSETKKKFPGFWSIPGGHIDEGENPLTAAIREVEEETGIKITADQIKLKAVATHHHIDRNELYVAFAFATTISGQPSLKQNSEEGTAHWVSHQEAVKLENVFPPVKYYFDHVLNNNAGIIYNYSQWQNSQLVKVISELIDKNS